MEDLLVLVQLFSFGIGILTMGIGSIWFYVETFKESAGWFFACLIIPIASHSPLSTPADNRFIPHKTNKFPSAQSSAGK